MRLFFLLFLLFFQFLQASVPEKFSNSRYCIGCHVQKGLDWKTTWHSRSNSKKNSLYRKTIKYISDMTYKSVASVDVSCGECHSPKMGVKKIDFSYDLASAFGVETDESKKVKKEMHNKTADDGISCIICHNIDKIKHSKELNMRGYEAVVFGPSDVMSGPFEDSHRTTFHKMQKRDYFNQNVDRLCLVCHYGNKRKGIYNYATGIEYKASKSSKKCVDCHMGKLHKSIVAPSIVGQTKALTRETRRHLFEGARNSDILKRSLKVSVTKSGSTLNLEIQNMTPHKVPTGFSAREIEILVIYRKGSKVVDKKKRVINTLFVDKNSQETLSYIADKMVYDKRLKPNEIRRYTFSSASGADSVKIKINYRLIKSSLIPILQIKDKIFIKEYPVYEKDISLL